MPKIQVELEMTNDGSQFSQEDVGIWQFTIIILVLFIIFLGKSLIEFYKEFKYDQTFENPTFILIISLNSDLLCLIFTVIHLTVMAYDGEGIFVLSIFARIFQVVGQVGIAWILLMIAFGWTITFKKMDDMDLYVSLAVFIVILHMLIVALTFIDDDEHHKFHDFSGIQGIVLIIIRLIIYGVFLWE